MFCSSGKKLLHKCFVQSHFTWNNKHPISLLSNAFFEHKNGNNADWQKAITSAEKIVGFPTSFLSLRALLSEELQGMAGHLKKFVETKHPLLKTARGILFDSKNFLQTRGLVTLLISKCASSTLQQNSLEDHSVRELYAKQRSLAEITELINLGFLVHRGLVDVNTVVAEQKNVTKNDMEIGNKIAVLGGDYLLANASAGLSKLHNSDVVGLMSNSIVEMSSGFFFLPENDENLMLECLKDLPSNTEEWEGAVFLAHGSLLSNSCYSSLVLGGYSRELGEAAKMYGKYFALAQQANNDTNRFNSMSSLLHRPSSSSICTLPFVLLRDTNKINVDNYVIPASIDETFKVDHKNIYKDVNKTKNVINECKEICNNYVTDAVNALVVFPTSDAKEALIKLANSVRF